MQYVHLIQGNRNYRFLWSSNVVSLIGTLMYRQNDYEQAVEWISSGAMITEPLVTGHFPFEEYEEAYRFIEKHGDTALKIVIDLD